MKSSPFSIFIIAHREKRNFYSSLPMTFIIGSIGYLMPGTAMGLAYLTSSFDQKRIRLISLNCYMHSSLHSFTQSNNIFITFIGYSLELSGNSVRANNRPFSTHIFTLIPFTNISTGSSPSSMTGIFLNTSSVYSV